MTEPLPTKADMDFFASEEAAPLQELWEPRFGDLVCDPKDGNRIAILAHQVEVNKWQAYWPYAKRLLWADVEKLIFLPRQGQLQAMLSEKGYRIKLYQEFASEMWMCEWQLAGVEYSTRRHWKLGPTPSFALGRALLEAIQRGKK